jgi:predicted GNAT family acetyltransferase
MASPVEAAAPPSGFLVARPLELRDAARLHAFLRVRPAANAFALGWLVRYGLLDRATPLEFQWLGAFDGDRICAAALNAGKTVAVVSHAAARAAQVLGARIVREAPALRVIVGPRDVVSTVADVASPSKGPRRTLQQRLFVLDALPSPPPDVPLVVATAQDRDAIVQASLKMAEEDAGAPLAGIERQSYIRAVDAKIREGRVWCVRHEGRIAFTASMALAARDAAQVEGVFVPADMRRTGIATRGMAALCAHLLEDHRRVSLYANEASPAAMALYDRVGFQRRDAFATAYL